MTHVVLLLLVSGENTDLADVRLQEAVQHRVPETSRSSGNEEYFVFENGHILVGLLLYLFCPYVIYQKTSPLDLKTSDKLMKAYCLKNIERYPANSAVILMVLNTKCGIFTASKSALTLLKTASVRLYSGSILCSASETVFTVFLIEL